MSENDLISQMLFNILLGFPTDNCCNKECKKKDCSNEKKCSEEKKEPFGKFEFNFDVCPDGKEDETAEFVVDLDDVKAPEKKFTDKKIPKSEKEPCGANKPCEINTNYWKVVHNEKTGESKQDDCSCTCHIDASPNYCITTDSYRMVETLKNKEVRDELRKIIIEAIRAILDKGLSNLNKELLDI